MFRPRHAYRSPITHRYKGKAHGCPVFNNLSKFNSAMVELHDECLGCLAFINPAFSLDLTKLMEKSPQRSISNKSEEDSWTCSGSTGSMSPTPLSPTSSSPTSFINILKGPRLKLSEKKIRRILKRPLIFDDLACINNNDSQPMISNNSVRTGMSVFQSAPIFVNNLVLRSTVTSTNGSVDTARQQNPASKKELGQELLKCAICGIQQRPPMIIKIYGQNSCRICSEFFESFIEWPKQFYCAQDGDCLMTFDSRCRACWIKICLQKFDTDEEYRKIGHKFSPKLLSSPNVSLITIDTSSSNGSPMSTSRTTPSTLSPGPQSLLMVKTKRKAKLNNRKKKIKSSNKNQQLKTNCISIQTD